MYIVCQLSKQCNIIAFFLQDNSNKEDKAWVKGVGDHYLATVLYTFETDREEELSVVAGQNIRLAPKHAQPR